MIKPALLAAAALALPACSTLGSGESGYSAFAPVRVHRVSVGDGSLVVTPPRPYNRFRSISWEDIREVEDWTLNGPYLDGISFVTGLKSDRYLIRQRRTASQQVPKFRANMVIVAVLCFFAGLILDTVTRGRREVRRLAYLSQSGPGAP